MKMVLLIIALLLTALWLLDALAPQGGAGNSVAAVHQGDAATGRVLFGRHCAECHGQDVRGTDKGPPLLHRYYRPDHHSDLAFQLAPKNGVVQHHWHFGNMPPVPGVNSQQVQDIIAWVRAEQRRAGVY